MSNLKVPDAVLGATRAKIGSISAKLHDKKKEVETSKSASEEARRIYERHQGDYDHDLRSVREAILFLDSVDPKWFDGVGWNLKDSGVFDEFYPRYSKEDFKHVKPREALEKLKKHFAASEEDSPNA